MADRPNKYCPHCQWESYAGRVESELSQAKADLAKLRERQPCDHCQTTHAPITPSCCEKSEALAEERGRVIENLRGVVVAARSALVVGSPERTDVVLQMIHKALTPEPAKEDGNNA